MKKVSTRALAQSKNISQQLLGCMTCDSFNRFRWRLWRLLRVGRLRNHC
jgi:hypothetical protein